MLVQITSTVGAKQAGELRGRLEKQGDDAPAAEWEIAAIWSPFPVW
jgi:hypothetical protein